MGAPMSPIGHLRTQEQRQHSRNRAHDTQGCIPMIEIGMQPNQADHTCKCGQGSIPCQGGPLDLLAHAQVID